jgi:AAA15 family ATPase/GTPase
MYPIKNKEGKKIQFETCKNMTIIKNKNSIYEGRLFVCFVSHVEISQIMVPLATLVVPLESSQ